MGATAKFARKISREARLLADSVEGLETLLHSTLKRANCLPDFLDRVIEIAVKNHDNWIDFIGEGRVAGTIDRCLKGGHFIEAYTMAEDALSDLGVSGHFVEHLLTARAKVLPQAGIPPWGGE